MSNRPFNLLLSLLICFSTFIGCAPARGSSSAPQTTTASREAVFAFAGLHTAWAMLDEREAAKLAAISAKNDPALARAELPKAEDRVARLHRIRDALEIARGYLAGTKTFDDARAALRDAAALCQLLVDEMKAEGVSVPEEISTGLAAAGAFL